MSRVTMAGILALANCISACCSLRSQEPAAPELRVEATARSVGPGQWDIRADLGEVPAVPVVQIVLSVKNPTDEDIVLGTTFSGCKCLKATLSREVIKPNEVEEIKLTLAVEKIKREIDRWVVLSLAPKDAPDRNTRIHIKYKVAGMLLFAQDSIAFEFPEGGTQMQLDVPIIFTPPVEPGEALVYGKGALEGLRGKVIRKGTAFQASIKIESSLVGSGVSGWLVVEHPKTGQTDSINCIIDIQKKLECVPTILQFRWSEEQKAWTANAIIRINDTESAEPQLVSSTDMRVTARSEQAKIECKVTQLKMGVARVTLKSEIDLSRISNDSESNKVTWFIDYAGKEYRDSNRFILKQ